MSANASKYMRHVASIIFLFCLASCWNIWASRCDERRDFLDAIARSSSYSSSNSLGSRLKSEEELIPSEDADTASDDCDDDEDAPMASDNAKGGDAFIAEDAFIDSDEADDEDAFIAEDDDEEADALITSDD